ncbi:putative bacitracin resistance protein [Thiovulum sp. ES]|nr:putative bacitracin resistance protein [Thiovulum sp. ES]
MTLYDSAILGVVEGITEYLPVSSTAHLVLTSQLLDLEQNEFMTSFQIIIQIAPIFSVMLLFWSRLIASFDLWIKLGIAFVPTGFVGLFFHEQIEALFTSDLTILFMFLTGIAFLIFEFFIKEERFKFHREEQISFFGALGVGIFQVFALIPGVSRSGSTILGAMIFGFSRELAMRFSFLLAIPTMGIASAYTFFKSESVVLNNLELLGVGFIVSFLFGIIAIKGFLHVVSNYKFIPFGIYLIVSAGIFYFFL